MRSSKICFYVIILSSVKYFIIVLLFFVSILQNCKTDRHEFSEIQRNLFFYLITPPRSNVSNSSSNTYQTIFTNNCKTVSSSLQDNLGISAEDFIVDDMIFSKKVMNETSNSRSTYKTGCSNLWNGGVVPFEIDPNFTNVDILYSAFTTWENYTVIRFIKKTSMHRDYIYITPSTSCSSYVGRIGGAQNLNLATACSYKNMLHELGHAISLYHEHQRLDRDYFITIYTENIRSDQLTSFNKLFPSYSFSPDYDIYSIMHYTAYAFSANSRPTITLKDQSINFGNSGIISSLDTQNVNALYERNFNVINNIPIGYYR